MTLLDLLVDGKMKHGKMHNIKRDNTIPSNIFLSSRISLTSGNGASATATATDLSTAARTDSALTTIIQTVVESITQPATTLISTHPHTVLVTDSASYSSLRASESSESARTASTASPTSSTPASTSSAAAKSSSSNNLGTLIPAIVVPVAVILLISFATFWFIMRRRHQKQLKDEPEFVMATKHEKPLSRGNSNSSGTSSTRELVPMSKLEKEMAVTTTEIRRPSIDLFPPKYSSADIGVARPMTPPDKAGANSNPFAKEVAPSVPNFSSVRPSTSGKSRPNQDKSYRNRSHSIQSRDAPTPRAGGRTTPQGLRGPLQARGPSPALTGPRTTPSRPPRPDDPDTRPEARSPQRSTPPSVSTSMSTTNRSAPPQPLNPPTPTGAFNGASPISQYSPIVKEMHSLGAVTSDDSPLPVKARRTDSPLDDNVLSRENMRIARLANSSRLGFANSPTGENFSQGNNSNTLALSPLLETLPRSKPDLSHTHSLPSPELPPPLTRSDLPPKPFARGLDSPAGGSSIYPSPSIGAEATPRLGTAPSQTSLVHNGLDTDRSLEHRVSVVSRLSSDDGYVDMELDAKSDVSSLDEREKWEMESERVEAASRLGTGYNGSGYGSAGMSPIDGPNGGSSAGMGRTKPSGSSNLRDRDSEGPFVLSRY